MLVKTERFAQLWRVLLTCGLLLLLGLALALRIALLHIETSDYTVFLSQWYDYIQTHGGLAALKDTFANYNTPYLTLLALATYLPIAKIVAIKGISILFDGVLGLFVYLILRMKYRRSVAAFIGVLVLLFAPTIFINSAAWGQCDAIYAAFCLGSLYFLLKRRPGQACVFFALALAFKLQAIFFAPVLLLLVLKRYLPLRYLVLIPLVFALTLTPALIAGRSVVSLLSIYPQQIAGGDSGGFTTFSAGNFNGNGRFQGGEPGSFNGFGRNNSGQGTTNGFPGRPANSGPGNSGSGPGNAGRFNTGQGAGGSESLTLNAPSFYQWLPASAPANSWKWAGIILAALFIVAISVLLLLSHRRITPDLLLKMALLLALAIPFLLPEMHERYFYLADVLSILYVFYFPRYFFVAIVMQLCSLFSYAPYFLQRQIVPLSFVAGAVLILIAIVLCDFVRTLSARQKGEG
jgi:Gpi18-like mannosyltransferase